MTEPQTDRRVLAAATESNAQTQARAMQGWVWTLLYVGALTPLNFVVNAVLARQLGVEGFGRYSFLLTALSLGQALLALGYGAGVARWAAAHVGKGEMPELLDLLRRHTSLHTIWGGTVNSVLLVALLRPSLPGAVLAIAASFLAAFSESTSLALPALQRTDRAAQTALAGVIGVQSGLLVACLLTQDPETTLLARIAVGAALSPIRLLVLPSAVRRACLSFGRPSLPRPVLRFGVTSYVASLLGLLVVSRTEVVLLQWLGHAEVVGLYALAFGLAGQITALVDAAIGPLVPALTSVVSRDPRAAGPALVRSLKALNSAVALWAALTLVPAVALVPVVYGQDFESAARVLVFGAFASFIASAVTPCEALCAALGRPGIALRGSAAGLLVSLPLAFALIPRFGLYGAVTSNVVGLLVVTQVLLVRTGRITGTLSTTVPLMLRLVLLLVVITSAGALATVMPLLPVALTWVALLTCTFASLRCNLLAAWTAQDVQSLLAVAPRRVAPLLAVVLPRRSSLR